MPPLPPLPPGVDAITAGRYGLWLLGRRSYKRASFRKAVPRRQYAMRRGIVDRYCGLIVPWREYEYPGAIRYLSGLLGVKSGTAEQYLKPSYKLPPMVARRLALDLEARAAQCEALAGELREYAGRQKKLVRRVPGKMGGLR